MKSFVHSSMSLRKLFMLLSVVILNLVTQAQNTSELTFTNSSLYSGTAGQDNAVYRFQNVNNDLDALVKISGRSSTGVKLDNIDLTNTGFNKAFQPQVSYNNGSVNFSASWWMEFEVTFLNKNTSTVATVNNFQVTAIDIDGDGGNLRETDAFLGLTSYTVENNSLLTVSNVMNGSTVIGKQFTGVQPAYNGIDTTKTQVMATMTYTNTSVFKFRFGANTTGSSGATGRMYSAWFKGFTYSAPIISSLPVTLVSFTAALNNKKADLKWTTASEINVSHFVVERSTDGRNFSDAGLVFAYGNLTDKTNYSYTDDLSSAPNAIYYYRLRSVDNDGKNQYSEVRLIRLSQRYTSIAIAAYPNPTTSELRVTVPADWQGKAVIFEISNENGQRMKSLKTGSSSQTETFNVSDLPRGLYLVKASFGNLVAVQKFVKN